MKGLRNLLLLVGLVLGGMAQAKSPPFNALSIATLSSVCLSQGGIVYQGANGVTNCLAPGTSGQALVTNGSSANPSWSSVGSGTVTSVGFSLPSAVFALSGCTITTSGTCMVTFQTQAANQVFAGPTSGTGTPAFRALVAGDVPISASLDLLGSTQGDVLYRDTSAWSALAPGTSGQCLLSGGVAANPSWGSCSSGGSGTVTTVSVASANGFTGTVATATTTPIITMATSITGILQGNGTAISAASTTGSGNVVLASSPAITTPAITGVPTGSCCSTSALASTVAIRSGNNTLGAGAFIPSFTTTATAAGTTTLTVSSNQLEYFSGTTTQTVDLPVVSTLVAGMYYTVGNGSTGNVTVNSSGGNLVATVLPGETVDFTAILNTGTTAASWSAAVAGASAPGTVTSVACGTGLTGGTITTTGTCALSTPVGVANGGTGLGSGTSGGIPYYSGSTTLASSGALTASALVLGGGAGASPTVLGSLGTTTTVLHGNASGAPSFGAVSLTGDVTGTLPVASGGTGITNNPGVTGIEYVIDGGGSALTTGIAGQLYIPYSCTISAWTLLADQSGSIVVNVWKVAEASYPPTVTNKITASAPPTITSAQAATSTTLTGWTTSVSAGDTMMFNIDSITTITRVTLALTCTRN